MPPKKKGKGKKGKKKAKGPSGPPVVTTRDMLRRRERLAAADGLKKFNNLGDTYARSQMVNGILEDVALKTIMKTIAKQSPKLGLSGLRLSQLPSCLSVKALPVRSDRQSMHEQFNAYCAANHPSQSAMFTPDQNNVCLTLANTITEVNLSKNNLFNNDEVFEALSVLSNLTHLDLSYNYLNGSLSNLAGSLTNLEVFVIDNNHITSFNSPVSTPPVVKAAGGGATVVDPGAGTSAAAASKQTSSSVPTPGPGFSSSENGSAFASTSAGGSGPETTEAPAPIQAIEMTPGSLLSNWKKIRVISAANNSISSIPPEAQFWTKLTTFNLRNNKLKLLHGVLTLRQWTELQVLKLGNNLLSALPEDVACCTKLRELDVSYNNLSMLPRNLCCCVNLEVVQLGSNQIADVHPDFYHSCTKIKQLMLYRNKIAAIPPEISNLAQLEKLSLASNNLHSLPEEIGHCGLLKELYLNNNAKFSHFPSAAGHLRNLQELAMRKCPALKALPTSAGEMSNLRELDVRAAKKQVCKIPPDVAETLARQHCSVRGGVVKKAKGSKGKKPTTA